MKFKPTPAKAHAGVALFLLAAHGKILLQVIWDFDSFLTRPVTQDEFFMQS